MSVSDSLLIRPAKIEDIPDITEIYGHHVRDGLASFEYVPPDQAEMTRRFVTLKAGDYPYYVAEKDNLVVGYAYAGAFRDRPGYRYSVECTVYLSPDEAGRGVGSQLLEQIVEDATKAGFRQMIAVIGDTDNFASIRIHEKAGFRHCGILQASGLKLGRWVDSVYMQRALGEGSETLPE